MILKILLTGASGFVGSHILDSLLARDIPTAILLRPSSSRRLIAPQLPKVEVREGAIDDPPSLRRALKDITHIIHCAGATKARRVSEFYDVNQTGTRNVVEAANAHSIQRLIHISSLAAAGPATAARPVRETDPPRPVSEYGKSKLAGEQEVAGKCKSDFVIVRPPAVYGPRDAEFLRLFKAIKGHILPRTAPQPLSMVFVRDLADGVVEALTHPAAARKTYFIAGREVVTAGEFGRQIAFELKSWTLPLPLPTPLFWPICLGQEILTRLTGKANVLSLQKYAELSAPGWVCDPSAFARDTGFECQPGVAAGVAKTLRWYQENQWL